MAKKDYSALVANVMNPSTSDNTVAIPNTVSTTEPVSTIEPEPKAKVVEKEKTSVKKDKVFSAIIDEELLEKMRYIAKSNDISFKSVIEASFKKSIASFEEKNGAIILPKRESGRADELF